MARVVVVGAGILGSTHALAAHDAGHEVVHVDRDPVARGASVRNFGLVWVSGRAAGRELDLARRSRELWGGIGERVPGVGFRAHGSLTLARTDLELKLLDAAASLPDASDRGFELLGPDGVRALNPAVGGEVTGGLHARHDAIVEPRLASAALVEHLRGADRYAFHPGVEVTEIGERCVVDATGTTWSGDRVVVCSGAWHTGALTEALRGAPLRRVRLQMLQTRPSEARLTTSIADIDSLRYYPAYAELPLDLLDPQPPVAAQAAAQLLLAQRLDGSLTIGDTHASDEPFPFDVEDDPYDHLLGRAEQLLGAPPPPVARRWAGVYSQVTDGSLYLRREVTTGVELVTGPGGRGMTLAPAIAEETFG